MSSRNAGEVTQRWGGALRDDTKNGCLADYLNVGILKTYGENLVVAFLVFFFLVDDERDLILRMQINIRCVVSEN